MSKKDAIRHLINELSQITPSVDGILDIVNVMKKAIELSGTVELENLSHDRWLAEELHEQFFIHKILAKTEFEERFEEIRKESIYDLTSVLDMVE